MNLGSTLSLLLKVLYSNTKGVGAEYFFTMIQKQSNFLLKSQNISSHILCQNIPLSWPNML